MSDLAPIGAALVDRAEDLAARCVERVTEPDDFDSDDFDEARTEGIEALRAVRWSRIVPSRFAWATVADFTNPDDRLHYQPALAGDLTEWGRNPQARNLVLLGPVGCAKTHAAVAAARIVHDAGQEVKFLAVGKMLDLLKAEMDGRVPHGILYALADVDVLVLDDLGSERRTDWTEERLYTLINERWAEERPTVVTSNLPPNRSEAPDAPATLEETVGPRVFSRLVGSEAVVLRLSGPDRRRKNRG